MKYNENNITEVLKNEKTIWKSEDLDWFDCQLVNKLQNNELPEHEKNTLIEMMANDQLIMDRYLQLKQQTTHVNNSMVDRFLSLFKTTRPIPLLATGLALIISLVVIFKQTNQEINYESDQLRGIPQASISPIDSSHIKEAPTFFIVNNKDSQQIRIKLSIDNSIVWISEFQQSKKFYLPKHIHQKLMPGEYSWSIIDKNKNILSKNSFTIN